VETHLKKSILALCALTLAAGLAACGGGSSKHTVGGTVTNLQEGPLVLVTNGMEVAIEPQKDSSGALVLTTNYAFPKQLEYGEAYSITLKPIGTDASGATIYQQPPHQVCGPSNARGNITSDTAGRLSVINAQFVCNWATHTIGGQVTGLTADNLVLTNGGNQLSVPKDATSFTFATQVTYNTTYGVTVLTQPTGQTCTVTDGAGVMKDENITSIRVNCTTNPVPVT
jgi:RNase P/RNase MRP subunit p29